jgi:hypothetical protein
MLEPAKIIQPSGDPTWDQVALKAVSRNVPMPLGENGEARRSFTLTLTPMSKRASLHRKAPTRLKQ